MAMTAVRCKECGDVRWSIMGFSLGRPKRCELCGGEVLAERRLPGHAAKVVAAANERRDTHLPAAAGR